MSALLLRLEGPLQSWSGDRDRFRNVVTARQPSKSGVVGLLAAACGVARTDGAAIGKLAACPLHVREDRPGDVLRDYHTVGGLFDAQVRQTKTAVTERYYLADASFLAALEGPEGFLRELADALYEPVWPIYLGRKACVPACPVLVSLETRSAEECLRLWPRAERAAEGMLRLVLECAATAPGAVATDDVPSVFEPRQAWYGRRYVETAWTASPPLSPFARTKRRSV